MACAVACAVVSADSVNSLRETRGIKDCGRGVDAARSVTGDWSILPASSVELEGDRGGTGAARFDLA
jgi:hypothetical protein